MKKEIIAFVLHGKLKKQQQLRTALERCVSSECAVEFYATERPAHAMQLTTGALMNGARSVIAVGGDGLLNEVVNGYMACPENIRAQTSIGVYPQGTGNDFCKTIGIKKDMEQLNALLRANTPRLLDACLMHYLDTQKQPAQRWFVNISDIGIGGYVSQRIARSSKLLGATVSYMKAIILTFISYRHRRVRLTAENFEWEGKALLLVMANGKYFGSGLCIAPQAVPDDGKMQLVLLGNVSLFDYLKHQGEVRRGEIISHPEVQYAEATRCRIEPLEECTIDMDGEFAGYGPLETQVVKKTLRFLY